MHETLIVDKIIKEAKKQGNISSIMIELGELCDIYPEELENHLKEQVNWKVDIIYKKGIIKCSCKYRGPAEILDKGHGYCVFRCPNCKNKPEVIEGGEIKIIGVK